ncbi:hypothetical protein [Acinetobacter sp. NIPH 2699]|uniref:hypothetical protein n=1 Tax=Acinetobacter sp. NIPH 2699 TaxID=2923433 RepID=UPI001F4C1C8B|nr:hypothetical protein [Acinetobacter sp. NIPH 2699]MCH7337817.1 hypothetical protein [Acinetobacter sp. NIPH 2699]
MAYCCFNCFNDNQIKKDILSKCHAKDLTRCSFCRSSGVQLIEAEQLFEYFEVLIQSLSLDENGLEVVDALQEYFSIFNNLISNKEMLVRSIFKNNLNYLERKYSFSYSKRLCCTKI